MVLSENALPMSRADNANSAPQRKLCQLSMKFESEITQKEITITKSAGMIKFVFMMPPPYNEITRSTESNGLENC